MNDSSVSAKRYSIKRQSLPESLALSLRERILNGEFQPGEPLIQEALAEEYECSRMPVREAFRQLEAAGLIVTKVHKGAVVASLPPDKAIELFELRAVLECDLLERAIPRMTDQDLSKSAQALQTLQKTYEERDMARWGSLNWEFHRSLYAPANRVQTMSIVEGINLQVERYITLQLLISESFEIARNEHNELLRLCAKRDIAKAVPFLRQHITSAGNSLVSSLVKNEPSFKK